MAASVRESAWNRCASTKGPEIAAMAQVPPSWTRRSGRTSWRGATRPRTTMWTANTTAQPKVSRSPTSWAFPAAPPPDRTAMPNTAMTTPAICGAAGRFLKKTRSMSGTKTTSRPVRKPLREAVVRCCPSICRRKPAPRNTAQTRPSRKRSRLSLIPPRSARNARSSAKATAIRTATSRMGETGDDPDPTSTRTMAKVDPHTAMSTTSARSAISRAYEIESDGEDGVDGDEERAFQPVRLAVERDDGGCQHREADRRRLESREIQVHRRPEREPGEDEDRRDEERDLLRRFPGYAQGDVHLAAAPEGDGRRMLRRVSDDGDDDDAHERLGQADRLQRSFERSDEQLARHRRGRSGEEQPSAGPPRIGRLVPLRLPRGRRFPRCRGKEEERFRPAGGDHPPLGAELEEHGERIHDD